MNGSNRTHSVHFDPSVRSSDPDSGRSSVSTASAPFPDAPLATAPAAAGAPVPARNSGVHKILLQTLGEHFEDTTVAAVQSFVAGVDKYCASTESLASLGKSLYTSPAVVFAVDDVMRVILWNDCAVQFSGYSREEMAGRNLLTDVPNVVPPSTAKILADALVRCVAGTPIDSVVLELTGRTESRVTLLASCTPLVGNPVGAGMLVVAYELNHLPFTLVDKKAVAETPVLLDQNQGTRTLDDDGVVHAERLMAVACMLWCIRSC